MDPHPDHPASQQSTTMKKWFARHGPKKHAMYVSHFSPGDPFLYLLQSLLGEILVYKCVLVLHVFSS